MLLFTPAQWLVLALVLVGGWLLGLASHPGGRRWKTRYIAERDAHAAYRRDADARVTTERDTYRTSGKETESRLAAADARIAELERENARLARATPVAAQPIASRERVVASSSSAARPAYPPGERRGWFDWGRR